MHQTEEDAAHQKAEAGECHHGDGLKVVVVHGHLELSTFFQSAAGQQLVQTPACVGRLNEIIERVQP